MRLSEIDEQLLQLALREDLNFPFLDITTETLFADQEISGIASLISKQESPFILCGIPVLEKLLHQFPQVKHTAYYQDGDCISPGTLVLSLQGSLKTILMLERTLLNFIQHLSAIATNTCAYVEKIKHTSLKVLDTRKTTPGFRHLDKYAVHCGGGSNHREGLYDAILIKDNHIDALGGVAEVLKRLPDSKKYHTVIEIRTLKELEEVLNRGASKIDRVLLDNMELIALQECAELCKGKITTEASGNIDLNSIVAVAETGVDFASVGRLTHSFKNIDLSLQVFGNAKLSTR